MEHGIKPDGTASGEIEEADYFGTYFKETSGSKYVPRAVFVDLEPTCIDQIHTGNYRNLFDSDDFIAGKEDSAKNFAQG